MAIFGLVRLGPAAASTVTPTAAVDAIKAAGAKRILNDYDFGGYLIRAAELHGESFLLRYRNAVLLSDLAGLIGLLDEYDIGATLLSPHLPRGRLVRPGAGLEAALRRRHSGRAVRTAHTSANP